MKIRNRYRTGKLECKKDEERARGGKGREIRERRKRGKGLQLDVEERQK